MNCALQAVGLGKRWGDFRANDDVNLSVSTGARHALIGPNGAGKSTFIHLITGYLPPSAGEIYVAGERVTKLAQHDRVRRGVARTFQVNKLFLDLTVLESVVLVVLERQRKGWGMFRSVSEHGVEIEEARSLLTSLHLLADANTRVRKLPYGKQRLVEIALALANKPRVLLLDEPAAGIPAGESTEVFEVISQLPRDVTILFIEHDMDLVFRFAERITVLVSGRVLFEGTPREVADCPIVKEVYLGEAVHA